MGTVKMIGKNIIFLCLIGIISAKHVPKNRFLDWQSIVGASVGAGTGGGAGALTGAGLGSLTAGALTNNNLIAQGLGALAGAGALGAGGAATGLATAPESLGHVIGVGVGAGTGAAAGVI